MPSQADADEFFVTLGSEKDEESFVNGTNLQYSASTLTTLRQLVGTVAGMSMSPINRVKAIAQIAYEQLRAHSVVVYVVRSAHEDATRHMDSFRLLAMPGINGGRELMWGATDSHVFLWEADNETRRDGVWLEDEGEVSTYLSSLSVEASRRGLQPTKGSFRKRAGEAIGPLAKLYLEKGIGHTCDPVGLVFLNFPLHPDRSKKFVPALREALLYLAVVIRELLVEHVFHSPRSEEVKSSSTPDDLYIRVKRRSEKSRFDLQAAIGAETCEVATELLGVPGIEAEYISLISENFGRLIQPNERNEQSIIVHEASILRQCISHNKFWLGRNADIGQRGLLTEASDYTLRSFVDERFHSVLCAPVCIDSEVCGVLRFFSVKENIFHDYHAHFLRDFIGVLQSVLLRVRSEEIQKRVPGKLAVFSSAHTLSTAASNVEPFKSVAQAVGAATCSFWELQTLHYSERFEDFSFSFGIGREVDARGDSQLIGNDVKPRMRKKRGVTAHLLWNQSRLMRDTLLYIVHFLNRESALLVVCRFSENGVMSIEPPEMLATEKTSSVFGIVGLNSLDYEKHKTRIGIAVKANAYLLGVIWLGFELHSALAVWDRQFLVSVVQFLSKMKSSDSAEDAIEDLQHWLRHMTGAVIDESNSNAKAMRAGHVMSLLRVRSSEMASIIHSREDDRNVFRRGIYELMPLGSMVQTAMAIGSDFAHRPELICQVIYEQVDPQWESTSLFLSVLSNLLVNAWNHVPPSREGGRIVVLIRRRESQLVCWVGNIGPSLSHDPFVLFPVSHTGSGRRARSGVGLRLLSQLLQRYSGSIRDVSGLVDLPAPVSGMNVVIEVTFPPKDSVNECAPV